jgi:HTH-type transcriptional regulator / antitoxin HigA
MDIRPLRSEIDYDWALKEIEQYFMEQPAPGTYEADRFDLLANLLEVYETKHWPIESADPVEAIRYSMELKGLRQSDLARVVGSQSRASEILNRKRPLTLPMIQRLHKEWGIPADALIAPYHVDPNG